MLRTTMSTRLWRLVLTGLVMASSLSAAGTAWAQDPIHKMGRGVVNVLTGWIEIPKYVHRGGQARNPITGMGHGLLTGASLTLLRAGLGLFEAVTFPIPYPKHFASPYEPMELSDYAWE